MTPDLILASSSPYRAELLRRLGLPLQTDPADIDETVADGEPPADAALRLAQAKAHRVAQRHPAALVIGSDQLASLHGQPLGKPGTQQQAERQLAAMSGQEVVFHTALCLVDGRRGTAQIASVPCVVGYRTLDVAQIRRYLAREAALDCAGATKIEALGISLTRYVRCDDPTALIGLPLISLVSLLTACGVEIP